MTQLDIRIIPILKDNYSYLIADRREGVAMVVDPAEPEPVIRAIEESGYRLQGVLCTHHHYDHSGGNLALKARFSGIEVFGGVRDAEKIPGLTKALADNACLSLGGLSIQVLGIACHTRGHVAYHVEDALFTGDTLFVAGCGRFFEGDAAEMYHALVKVIGSLPEETRIFCGHEYTISNLRFAKRVEPENTDIAQALETALATRSLQKPTVPSRLGDERRHNPFLRVELLAKQQLWGESNPIQLMALLREKKNAAT